MSRGPKESSIREEILEENTSSSSVSGFSHFYSKVGLPIISGRNIRRDRECNLKPKKWQHWAGGNCHFFCKNKKPKEERSQHVHSILSKQVENESPNRRKSSKYTTDVNPSECSQCSTGFNSLVKTKGAVESPNGKHVNSNNLFLKLNRRNFLKICFYFYWSIN